MKFLCVILMFSSFIPNTAESLHVVGHDAPQVVEAGEDLVLPCSIQPNTSAVDMMVEWLRPDHPQGDRLVHLYEDHEDRNEQQFKFYRGRTSLFKEELQKGNTSLKLSAVQPSDEGVYKCSVRDKTTYWNDDINVYVQVNEQGFHAWKIIIICISVSASLLAVFTVWFLKDKCSKKDLSTTQCSAKAYMRLQSVNVRKDLDLKKYKTSEEGYRRLIPAVRKCGKAQFADCNLSEQSITILCSALQSKNCSLRELDLSNNNLQDSGVENICNELKSSHCKLEILRLVLCKLSTQSCNSLRSVLDSESSSLRELDLSNNNLQDSGVEEICNGLKSSHCKLEILRFSACNLTVKSCEYLTSVLQSKSSSLRELDLTHNDLQDSGVKLISDGLKSSHCKLETLRLVLCNFGEKSCESLGSILKQENWSLRELDLSMNDLQDSGVKLMCDGLKSSHCKLEILRLSACLVTDEGCSSLASALKSNPSILKELDLTYNHPGETGERLLSDTLQDTHCTLRLENSGKKWIKPNLRKYMCDVTLDLNTAHTDLSLSENNRKVEFGKERQMYPDHPDRFDEWFQVLSEECLPEHCYWEVEFSGRYAVVCVSYRSISRKGDSDECGFGYNNQSWSLECSIRYSVLHNNNRTDLRQVCKGERIGVYVNQESHTLSFYTISSHTHTHTPTHLHTFHCSFTEPLYAGFGLDDDSSVCVCV